MVVLTADPPFFLIVAGVLATLVLVAFVLFVLVRSIRREQRGFDVSLPAERPGDSHNPLR